eukprot:2304997-Rhodomonas_salina.1
MSARESSATASCSISSGKSSARRRLRTEVGQGSSCARSSAASRELGISPWNCPQTVRRTSGAAAEVVANAAARRCWRAGAPHLALKRRSKRRKDGSEERAAGFGVRSRA